MKHRCVIYKTTKYVITMDIPCSLRHPIDELLNLPVPSIKAAIYVESEFEKMDAANQIDFEEFTEYECVSADIVDKR